MSKDLRLILEKRDALVFCQHFLTCVLNTWPDHLTGLDNLPDVITLPPSRPDRDNEEEELQARLSAEVRDWVLCRMQIQTLKELTANVRLIRRADGFGWAGPRLLYRVHSPDSHTFYHRDVGFCCPRWLRQRDFKEPSKLDFYLHVNGDQASPRGAFETPFISMTGSPLRALNFVQDDRMSTSDVYVINCERLWAANIHVERTTILADQYGIIYKGPKGYDRSRYITKTHWVAQYWIPADCIVMRMPFLQFQEVCREKGIFRGTYCPAH